MDKVLNSLMVVNNGIDTISKINQQFEDHKFRVKAAVAEFLKGQEQLISESFTCKEICALLGITEPTLIKRRKAGKIPYFKLGNNYYYLDPQVYEGGMIYG